MAIQSTKLADHADCQRIRLSRIEVNDILFRARMNDAGQLTTSLDTASEVIVEVRDERPYCESCGIFLDADGDWLVVE